MSEHKERVIVLCWREEEVVLKVLDVYGGGIGEKESKVEEVALIDRLSLVRVWYWRSVGDGKRRKMDWVEGEIVGCSATGGEVKIEWLKSKGVDQKATWLDNHYLMSDKFVQFEKDREEE
jgi:hypothetical protein